MHHSRHLHAASRLLRGRHTFAATIVTGMALGLVACGGSAVSPSTSTPPQGQVVRAAEVSLQGCTYTVNNSIPYGEPTGVKPNFTAFTPDAAADAAVAHIAKHGGVAMVDSAGVPAGTTLYRGPDTEESPVGTVPKGHSVLMAEPVVWTDAHGTIWLATFIACGGPYLYWASLHQVAQHNPAAAATLRDLIKQLTAAPPYSKSDQASLMPISVKDDSLVWVDPSIQFSVGRGQLIANLPDAG